MFPQLRAGVGMSLLFVKANQIAQRLGCLNFKANKGWFCRFVERFDLRRIRLHGEAGDVNLETFATRIQELKRELSTYPPENIFNMDETGLFFR